MADVSRIQAVRGRRVGEEGSPAEPALGRGAETIVKDWIDQMALEGRIFHAQQGDAGTHLDFAETAYDEDQPQGALRVPKGISIMLLSLVFNIEDSAGTDNQFILSRTTNDIGNGTSTALTVSCLRSDEPRSSKVEARSLYTANATAATGLIEIGRGVDPFVGEADAGHWMRLEFSKRTLGYRPVLVGPATLQWHVYATTDGPEGFAEVTWIEDDTADMVKS